VVMFKIPIKKFQIPIENINLNFGIYVKLRQYLGIWNLKNWNFT